MRKVQDTGDSSKDWRFVHHLVWIEAGRELPPGHFLFFKDGDCTNITLENLELVPADKRPRRLWDKKRNESKQQTQQNQPMRTIDEN